MIATTSWDDGHELDLRLADLLDRHGFKGTFYVPVRCKFRSLSDPDIRELSQRHEIGAHSMTHRDMTALSAEESLREGADSKSHWEDVLGCSVPMFCYPQGRYNSTTIDAIRRCGFAGARTTKPFTDRVEAPLEMGVTLHCYPHPLRKRDSTHVLWTHAFEPFQRNQGGIQAWDLPWRSYWSWTHLAKATFDHVRHSGGIWHIWGHSWEIEEYGMWADLEEVLRYASGHSELIHKTNGEIARNSTHGPPLAIAGMP